MIPAFYPKAIHRPIGSNKRARRVSMEEVLAKGALVQHSAEGYGSLFNLFNNPARRGSTHLWISKEGVIEQYVSFHETAWGNGCGSGGDPQATTEINDWARRGLCNDYTLASMELEGVRGEKMTDKQRFAIIGLWQWFVANGFKLVRDDSVYRHYQFAATLCDSDRWPTAELIAAASTPVTADPLTEWVRALERMPSLWGTLAFWYGGTGAPMDNAPFPQNWPFGLQEDRALARFVTESILSDLANAQGVSAVVGHSLAALIPSYKDATEADVALCELGD